MHHAQCIALLFGEKTRRSLALPGEYSQQRSSSRPDRAGPTALWPRRELTSGTSSSIALCNAVVALLLFTSARLADNCFPHLDVLILAASARGDRIALLARMPGSTRSLPCFRVSGFLASMACCNSSVHCASVAAEPRVTKDVAADSNQNPPQCASCVHGSDITPNQDHFTSPTTSGSRPPILRRESSCPAPSLSGSCTAQAPAYAEGFCWVFRQFDPFARTGNFQHPSVGTLRRQAARGDRHGRNRIPFLANQTNHLRQ